jgi:hypothetical protein
VGELGKSVDFHVGTSESCKGCVCIFQDVVMVSVQYDVDKLMGVDCS